MIRKVIVLLVVLNSALFAEPARDMTLGLYPPNAFVLSKGVLQLGTYLNYVNLDIGKALGSDIDESKSNGVGEYSETGGHIWFGLTDRTTVSFKFSLSNFEYRDKEAEVSFQELRAKRALIINHPNFGFVTGELAWRRHSTNELTVAGISQSKSNVLHDHGWGLRLLSSKPFYGFDLHSHIGYNHYTEDGDNGQDVLEFGIGISKFWNQRYQADLFYQHYRIDRNSPKFSNDDSDTNNTVSFGIARHLNDTWSLEFRGQFNDNLFRGYWPFMDREVDTLSFSRYGYLTIGATYRLDYKQSR